MSIAALRVLSKVQDNSEFVPYLFHPSLGITKPKKEQILINLDS